MRIWDSINQQLVFSHLDLYLYYSGLVGYMLYVYCGDDCFRERIKAENIPEKAPKEEREREGKRVSEAQLFGVEGQFGKCKENNLTKLPRDNLGVVVRS